MQSLIKSLQNNEKVDSNNIAKILNKINSEQRCYILNLLKDANNIVFQVNWSWTTNELLYLLPKISINNINLILDNHHDNPLVNKIRNVIRNGIKEDGVVKIIGGIFHKLDIKQRTAIFNCLKDVRLYSYSLKYKKSLEYLKSILEHLKDLQTYMAIKPVDNQLLEFLWDISTNDRVLNEMLKDGICKKWKIKKFPIKRNIAELLLPDIKDWQHQSFVHQQLLEFQVISGKKSNSDLSKMNNLIQQATMRPVIYIPYTCFIYQCCMQLMMDIPAIAVNKSLVLGPIAYLWIKSAIFKCLLNDTMDKLEHFIANHSTFDLVLSVESTNNLTALIDLCRLWLKMKLNGISSLSSIKMITIKDADINAFAECLVSFYSSNNGLLGHAYTAITQLEYLEAFKTFDMILTHMPTTIVDKLILYESFYLLLPFLSFLKCPKLLQGLASGINTKFNKYKMTLRLYKIQYWLDYLDLNKNKPISDLPHYSNQLLQSDLQLSKQSTETLVDFINQIPKASGQGISWFHDDLLEIDYRLLKLDKQLINHRIPLSLNASFLSYKSVLFKSLISQFQTILLKSQFNEQWVLNSVLMGVSTSTVRAYKVSKSINVAITNIYKLKQQIEEMMTMLPYAELQFMVSCLLELHLINKYTHTVDTSTPINDLIALINPKTVDVADLNLMDEKHIPGSNNENKDILMMVKGELTSCILFIYNNKMIRVPFDILEDSDELANIDKFIKYFNGLIELGQQIIRQSMDPNEWWKQRKGVDRDIEHALYLMDLRLELGMTILEDCHTIEEWIKVIEETSEHGNELVQLYCEYFEFPLINHLNSPKRVHNNEFSILFVLVDTSFGSIPFESANCCKYKSIYRIPNNDYIVNKQPATVKLNEGVYVLNPGTDLIKTEERLNMKLNHLHWERSEDLTEEKWFGLLDNPIFMYCGHGAGEKYYNPSKLSKYTSESVIFLMGCSSLKMVDYGIGMNTIAQQYLNIGCTTVIGTLWDVTDKDLDVQTISMLEGLQFKKDVSRAVQESREECKLKYLNASAMVCYGSPVIFE